jgi:hypothetical protein
MLLAAPAGEEAPADGMPPHGPQAAGMLHNATT